MPNEKIWRDVDTYFSQSLLQRDERLDAVLEANASADLPAHDVSPLQGQFLALLCQAVGARRILEIGTLGGYSTIWFARSIGPEGCIVTMELDPARADIARKNFVRAAVAECVDIRVGPASESLSQLSLENPAPFDIVFIDADKQSNPQYLRWALHFSRAGTVILVDNVVRGGAVADRSSTDPSVVGTRFAIELIGGEKRLKATAIQTVGSKGYDGFVMAVVQKDNSKGQ